MGLLSRVINTFAQIAPDGKEFIRVADIAPHAYDEFNDEFKVRVNNGKMVESLAEHTQYSQLNSTFNAYFGENTLNANIQFLDGIDVSTHDKRTVVIYNHHDQPVVFRGVLFYVNSKKEHREIRGNEYGIPSNEITIPAFNTVDNVPSKLVIDVNSYPFLGAQLPLMGVHLSRSDTPPTTGHVDVFVFGGK